ncbi:fibroblast growth factor receptor substrate 2 [Apis mellifera caucasica]|uniref:Fibroblast growth factor receptor substrate 2 n=1 Tax=Apis mellifera TaxID=7460 RepID=A0A7M7FZJ3_APIME|nr:fibroblast growth factor receptor substrate 2 [Apis mellifera]KAG6798661.1 fibroblast growth factor receptor substrate 2 [Apis mellifera caucasica]KAG9437178.1 fibroblast growth factor receptor substrate 2 [Apis mellifera carnica]|eukprot:XP_001122793.3 fibroblast growth factor receptor substrate 2 [Apis mellifera]
MGCVNSRTDINDLHPNIFQVMNVDDLGNLITPGRLEVTETDIVLYQRGKQPIKWPLRCLRRYGYDAEIFSFESGRRCSTGPGIYAFKCRRAAHLFNLVQTNIQVCNNSGDDTMSRELPVASHVAPTVTRVTIPVEPNYLDPILNRSNNHMGPRFVHNQQNGVGRLDSVGSSTGFMSSQGNINSPTSPPVLPPPPPPPPFPQPHPSSLYVNEEVLSSLSLEMEHNNNKSLRRAIQRSCTVSNSISDNGSASMELTSVHKNTEITSQIKSPLSIATYINIDINNDVSLLSPTHSISEIMQFKEDKNENNECGHAYININPQEHAESFSAKPQPLPLSSIQSDIEEVTRHCYANLESNEIENLRKRFSGVSIAEKSPLPPSTPTGGPIREVNYAVLDLDTKDVPMNLPLDGPSNSTASPPESPNKLQKGYATIDFNKTAALSHSVNPNIVNDNEGSRKTRHNSTISDLAASGRRSSSISE